MLWSIYAAWPLWLVSVFFFLPLGAGLIWVLLPAWGYLPVLGLRALGWEVWGMVWTAPGLWTSLRLTLVIGLGATLITLVVSMLIVTLCYTRGHYKGLQNVLAPLLAIPHLTLAAGLAFLLAPSGLFMRLLAPLFGWQQPPLFNTVPDRWGLVMMLLLCLKEIPFLLFIINGALAQVHVASHLRVATSLGYSPFTAWWKIIWPQVYPRIRLPLFIILVFSFVSVDIALILAPNAPPPFAVQLLNWYGGQDLAQRMTAAAGGVLLSALVGLVALGWFVAEQLGARIYRYLVVNGRRGGQHLTQQIISYGLLIGVVFLGFGSLLIMLVWSFAGQWQFPTLVPANWQITYWVNCYLCAPIFNSIFIAVVVALSAVVVIIGLLEYLHARQRTVHPIWFYIPLLVPQIVFLFGFDLLLLQLAISNYWKVLWAHWIYCLPYVFLIISLSYRRFDVRYEQTSLCLGASRLATLIRVKLPMLFRPILYAFTIAFAVSINEYLPTLIPGKGHIVTLTTEMANLAASGDRRLIGVTGVFQSLIPFVVFCLALLLPNIQARRRRGLQI